MATIPPVTVPLQVELTGAGVRNYSAAQRVLRTFLQVAMGLATAIPAAIALLPIPAHVAAWACGIAGATVLIFTTLQNALEAAGVLRPLLKSPPPAEALRPVATPPPAPAANLEVAVELDPGPEDENADYLGGSRPSSPLPPPPPAP